MAGTNGDSPTFAQQPGTSAYGEAQPVDLRPWQYLAIIARRWPVLLAIPLAGLAFVLFYNARRVPIYTAQVVLQRQQKASPLETLDAREDPFAAQQAVLSELEIIRSRSVLADAVDSLALRTGIPARGIRRSALFAYLHVDPTAPSTTYNVAPGPAGTIKVTEGGVQVAAGRLNDTLTFNGIRMAIRDSAAGSLPINVGVSDRESAIDALRGQVRPEQVRGTSLFRVIYKDRDPQMAADVLNALAYSYEFNTSKQARITATHRREFLSQQLAQVADSLQLAKSALQNYQQSSRIVDPKVEGAAATSELRDAETALHTLQFQEGLLQNLISAVKAGEPSDRGLQRMVAVSRDLVPASEELYRNLRDLENERSRLTASRFGYTPQGRTVQALDSLIASTRADLRGVTDDALQLLRAKRQSQQQTVNALSAKVGAIPTTSTAFGTLEQRVEAIQRAYDVLSQKQYEAQLSEAVATGNVQVIDRARAPLGPDPSNLNRNVILALFGGLFLALAIVATLEFLDSTVRTNEDATRVTGLEIIGVIPDFGKLDRGASRSSLEGYRKLKTALRFVRTTRPRAMLVTSSAPGEGKSVTAANLATALAKEGTRVLLVDADMHRPTVHTLFGIDRAPGLADVLVGESKLDACFTQQGESLFVLTVGTSAPHPAELFSSKVFQEVLSEMRKSFDYVLLDGPPVLAVADSSIISPLTDGVLFVVLAESTDSQALGQAITQLGRVNSEMLGLIMNRVPIGWRAYGSYYGYYEYGDYYKDPLVGVGQDRLIVSHKKSTRKKRKRSTTEV